MMLDLFRRSGGGASRFTRITAGLRGGRPGGFPGGGDAPALESAFAGPCFEGMESRLLLAVSAQEFADIRAAHPDLNLSSNMANYNVLEITTANLNETSLRNAITTAGNTTANDLIVVRTTTTQSTIYLNSELAINIDANTRGSVTIVSLGPVPLVINAQQKSRVFSITGSNTNVSLAGLTITNGRVVCVSTAQANGGGIYNSGTLLITNSKIIGNTVYANPSNFSDSYARGGGICNTGTLTVTNSAITGNTASAFGSSEAYAYGGGICIYSGTLTLTNSTVADNTAYVEGTNQQAGRTFSAYGGGIYCDGPLTIRNSIITGNEAYSVAIYAFNTNINVLTREVCGGGLYVGGATTTLVNVLIAKNEAFLEHAFAGGQGVIGSIAGHAYGGGVAFYGGNSASYVVTNTTITGNRADGNIAWTSGLAPMPELGGGIYLDAGNLTIHNTILAGNHVYGNYLYDDDIDVRKSLTGTIAYTGTISSGYSLIGAFSTLSSGTYLNNLFSGHPGNIVGTTNPGFVNTAIGNYRLAAGSPAINKGSNALIPSGITTDLAGGARIYNGTVDIGAYEYGSTPPTTQLARPTGILATAKNSTTVTMNWNAVANASSYTIQYATDSAFTQNVKTQNVSGGSSTSADVTGLSANTTYYFRVMAVGTGSYTSSTYSGWYSAKTPVAPAAPDLAASNGGTAPSSIVPGTAFSITTGTIQNIGTAASGNYTVTFYAATSIANLSNTSSRITIGSVSMPSLAAKASTTATLNATLTPAPPAGTYYVGWTISGVHGEITTGNNTGYRATPLTVTTSPMTTQLDRPSGILATAKNSTTVTMNWNAVSNASSYTIQYATDSAFTQNVKTQNVSGGSSTSADVTGLSPNTTYYFRVMAVGTGIYTSSTYSGWYSAKTPTGPAPGPTQLDRPSGILATAKNSTTVTMNWTAVANASSYTIQYATDSAFTQNVKTQSVAGGTSSSADVTGLTANTTYYFRVMAVGTGIYTSSTYSGWYAAKTPVATSIPQDRPTGVSASPKNATTVTVNWSPVSNASGYLGYVIQYATDSAFTQNVKTQSVAGVTSSSADVTGLTPNTMYYFRVKATGTGSYGDSTYSGWYSATTPAGPIQLDRPSGILATAKNSTTVTMNWTAVANASSYTIQYATDSAFTQNVKTQSVAGGTSSSADVTGLAANTTYYFRVMAVGTGSYTSSTYSGWYAAKTPVATSVPLDRPTGISASRKNATTVTVNWNAVSHASSYVIQYATDSAFTQNVKTQNVSGGSSTSADVTGLSANTTYYFRVMAVGTGSYISSTYSGWYSAKT